MFLAGGRNNAGSFATAEIFDPATGSFAFATGNMETTRSGHTATLFADGKVLIAGGFAGVDALATAEMFDPSSGVFTPTSGNMLSARGDHTANVAQ